VEKRDPTFLSISFLLNILVTVGLHMFCNKGGRPWANLRRRRLLSWHGGNRVGAECLRGVNTGASASQNLLQFLAYIAMVNEVSAPCRSQAEIDGLDEAGVIFQIAADDVLHEFSGIEAFLGCDLSQSGFLLRFGVVLP